MYSLKYEKQSFYAWSRVHSCGVKKGNFGNKEGKE